MFNIIGEIKDTFILTGTIPEIDQSAPSGYDVQFGDESYTSITISQVSIILTSCEVGSTYNYSISSSGGGSAIVGSGSVSSSSFTLSGIDCSGLSSGNMTVSFYLTDPLGNQGDTDTDTAIYVAFDSDALAFMIAAGITDLTQKSAINTLVVSLKSNSLWVKMKALYPYVNGTATSHKLNLKNPEDSDAAFRLQFNGGITHDANGVTGNGANGYARTYLNTQTEFDLNSLCLFAYSRTNASGNYYDMGAFSSSTSPANCTSEMRIRLADYFFGSLNSDDAQANPPTTDSRGFHAISRINSTQTIRHVRGTNYVSTEMSDSEINLPSYVMALNFNGSAFGYSPRNYACHGYSSGLTESELILLEASITEFQTTLGRNV